MARTTTSFAPAFVSLMRQSESMTIFMYYNVIFMIHSVKKIYCSLMKILGNFEEVLHGISGKPLLNEPYSPAIDGISLTVNEVQGERFTVTIIPHMARQTTLGLKKAGDPVNL